jgi:glycerophosphoryl diester phosphodiesterase
MTAVYGHRGASAHAVENTIAAFRRARADGADGVELDVRLDGGGRVVVFHDETLDRLAGRPGRIAELPSAALDAVRLAGGERVPTLDETLEELSGLRVNVEIKAPRAVPPRGLVAAVLAALRRHAATDVIVSSFNPLALLELRARAPEIPSGLLFHRGQARPFREAWARHVLRPSALHPEHALVHPPTVAAWRAAGLEVNAWTVDAPADVVRMVRAGVTGIISNDPAAARAAMARYG